MNYRNPPLDVNDWQVPLVVAVGTGMGKLDLSLRASCWIERAEVLVGGKRHLDDFAEHSSEKIVLKSPLVHTLQKIEEVSGSRRTMVLASGDPLFFGIGQRLAGFLGKDRLLVLPNVTAVQYLFARLAEPWDNVKIISLHGRSKSMAPRDWLKLLHRHEKIGLYTDPQYTPARVARELLEIGIQDRAVVVGENLGLPSENIQMMSLTEAETRDFSPLNIMLLWPTEVSSVTTTGQSLPTFGMSEDCFQHQAGLITKMEIRAIVLANLQLSPGLVLWDLGAGSGSVSIEAARIVPLRKAVAVERDPDRYKDLVENLARYDCVEIESICDDASNILQQLPDPDRVFIGGAGKDLAAVLGHAAERLRGGGRIVQTVVTLDTLQTVRDFWRKKPFDVTVTQVQINRSAPILNTIRLEALNPVFIVTACQRV